MGTGWRKAFCTTAPTNPEKSSSVLDSPSSSPSPRTCGFFSSLSNPSTPRFPSTPTLHCRTSNGEKTSVDSSPRLFQCRNSVTPKGFKTPKSLIGSKSTPSSPRSKLSFFRNSFKLRSTCGICLNSVKSGQGTAIYTAECSHAFHFPCIAAHVRKRGGLVCPVCNSTWTDVPLLAVHKNLASVNDSTTTNAESAIKPRIEEIKKVIQCSPRSKPIESRLYDDDEPLLTPRAGGRFIPIPEAEQEEEDEDVEEFQGFFPNPNSSSSIKSDEIGSNEREIQGVQVTVSPEAALISSGRGYETYAVAVTMKAPPSPPRKQTSKFGGDTASLLDPTQRAPIDLVTVLDVSGSMTGVKLGMLKRAVRLVISSLGPADRLSIVAFSATTKRLLPLRRMTAQGQRAARRIVDRLVCGQGTSVGEALRKATKVLENRRERNPVASIILLSDGQDESVRNNAANQRRGAGNPTSTRFAHVEIPVQTFGFGKNSGYSHEPAEDAFTKCVGGLLSVVVQDVRFQIGLQSGSVPAEITAVYSYNGRPTALSNSSSLRLGDLYAEEERELLIELKSPTLPAGTHHLMTVRCFYKDPVTQEVVYGRDQAILVPPPWSRSMAPKIEQLRYSFISARAIAESRRLIEHNDLTSAHHLLASSRALLVQSNSILAEEFVRRLEADLAELQWRKQQSAEIQRRRMTEREAVPVVTDENREPLTPTSAWRAAEKLAKVAIMKKAMNRVSDLHGFENARF